MEVEENSVDANTHLPALISSLQYARSFYSSDSPGHSRFAGIAALTACIQFTFRVIRQRDQLDHAAA